MLSNAVIHARRYIAALILAITALLPGSGMAETPADAQMVCQSKVFHILTTDQNGQIARVELLEGSDATMMSADKKHSYRIVGQTLDEERIRLTIKETTANEQVGAAETLILAPGAAPTKSTLASRSFALDDGSAQSSEGSMCERGIPRDPTTEGCGVVSCGGRSWGCCAGPGHCCRVNHCGVWGFCF